MNSGFMPGSSLSSHLDAEQGKGEQRTESYMQYAEGAAQPLTQQCAKSFARVSGSARKQGKAVRDSGFTIIETMIFLIITSVLLISAISIFNGRIGRTRFTQSTRDFDAKISGVINDVQSGFYPSDESFGCYNNGGAGPRLLGGGKEQGTNTDCIFIGKVIHFGVQNASTCPDSSGTECSDIAVYTIVGLRKTGSDTQVVNLAEAKPEAITITNPKNTVFNPNDIDIKDNFKLGAGLHVTKVINLSDGSTVGAVGIMSSLAQYSGTNLVSGGQKIMLIPVKGTDVGQDASAIATHIEDTANSFNETLANPKDGILVCLQSGSSSQKAAIKIGGNNREIGTDVSIDSGEAATKC